MQKTTVQVLVYPNKAIPASSLLHGAGRVIGTGYPHVILGNLAFHQTP